MDDAACTQPPGKVIPVVDVSRCEAKGACVVVCPYHVFEIRKIEPSDFANLGLVAKFKNGVHGGNLLPPCVNDCVGPDTLVRVVDAFIDSLDLIELGFTRAIAAEHCRFPA